MFSSADSFLETLYLKRCQKQTETRRSLEDETFNINYPSIEIKFQANTAFFLCHAQVAEISAGKFRQALQFGEQTMRTVIASGWANIFSLKIVDNLAPAFETMSQAVKCSKFRHKLLKPWAGHFII